MVKRKASSSPPPSPPSSARSNSPVLSSLPSKRVHVDMWPAPLKARQLAATFIKRVAASPHRCLLVPDKDADGLSSGVILHRTLVGLGKREEDIGVHHIGAGQRPGSSLQRRAFEQSGARWIIVLDQGSAPSPGLTTTAERGWDAPEKDEEVVRTLVIDHHHVDDMDRAGPRGSLVVNASQHEPVATSSLLAWVLCDPLLSEAVGKEEADNLIKYLAIIGTCGDLSTSVKWDPPWPDLSPELKRWGKSKIGEAIALLNAPRRTPLHDAHVSWDALMASKTPLDLLSTKTNPGLLRLAEARQQVKDETERCTHTPPKFSKDSRVALLTIDTPYQVHPSIATRWAGTLRGAKRLEVVMCANVGFGTIVPRPVEKVDEDVTIKEEGMKEEEEVEKKEGEEKRQDAERYVHFSCRIAGSAKARGAEVNVIEVLREYAARDATFLKDLEASGHEGGFANGHIQAAGSILPRTFWDRFVNLMEIGVKPDTTTPSSSPIKAKKAASPAQSNKLTAYFSTASPKQKT